MANIEVQFDHIHMYVRSLESLETYKALEEQFNEFRTREHAESPDLEKSKAIFAEVTKTSPNPDAYSSVGQDIVRQLITGVDCRITATASGPTTHSVLISSREPTGISFVITAPHTRPAENGEAAKRAKAEDFHRHFARENIDRFFSHQNDRQGVGCLGFICKGEGTMDAIIERYKTLHPKLLAHGDTAVSYTLPDGRTQRIFEAAAYYAYSKDGKPLGTADPATIIRYVEGGSSLAGLEAVEATFPPTGVSIFNDHWVSNVMNRNEFLDTMKQVLGFTPKVDFNAGVVAAGEAIIESTVTGNTPAVVATSPEEALRNNSQVYLPTNNALSTVGHVHLYLQEIGQGVQHIASRVSDLCSLVQRANDTRKATGEGFSFLNIPRSYYGRLTVKDLTTHAGLSTSSAEKLLEALEKAGLVSSTGITNLDIDAKQVATVAIPSEIATDFNSNLEAIQKVVLRSRYSNMYSFLGEQMSEAAYLKIVRNQVLVDIQGDDVLYQIFTSCILQEQAGAEAPFLEFIQRVCSEKCDAHGKPLPIKAGCGGFGIRNFLTLFLSIEVSKAMLAVETSKAQGDAAGAKRAQKMVDVFTEQLDESNPILTRISDAMTAEGNARELAEQATDASAREGLLAEAAKYEEAKNQGQRDLQTCSDKYKGLMVQIRESA